MGIISRVPLLIYSGSQTGYIILFPGYSIIILFPGYSIIILFPGYSIILFPGYSILQAEVYLCNFYNTTTPEVVLLGRVVLGSLPENEK